jgi:Na+-translocating ferredoxin:NAD+ oxidoreductase subunit E
MVDMLMEGFAPALHDNLGLFIPLIVVNCLVMGRAEAWASKNTPGSALIDGIGMGLGFAYALTLLGGVREILGSGTIFGIPLPIFPKDDQGNPMTMLVFVLAPGAFIALGYLIALTNRLAKKA